MESSDRVLDGKVALITGAARGLGLSIARAMVEAGAQVTMVARSTDVLHSQAAQLGPSALAVPADISDPEAVRAAMAATERTFGGLDILVNNAALAYAHRIAEITDREVAAEIGVNISGAIYCMREAVGLMRKRGGGDIVNISSESVTRPFPLLSLYSACKAAIENLAVGMREELRAENIRVTTLRAGVMVSDGAFMAGFDPEQMRRFRDEAVAGGHMRDVGKGISPSITARTLIHTITAPRESHLDFVCVRAI